MSARSHPVSRGNAYNREVVVNDGAVVGQAQDRGVLLATRMAEHIVELSACGDDPRHQAVMGRLCSLATSECRDEKTLR